MIRYMVTRVNHWDQLFLESLFGWPGKRIFDRTFYLISRSADGQLYGFIGSILLALHGRTEIRMFFATLIAFAFELTIYKLLKNGIRRPRPFDESDLIHFLIAPPDQYSFPSGHTAAAFLMAIILSVGLPQFGVTLFILAGLVGISRIYLGVHYPTDVVMGAVLGTVSGLSGLSIWSVLA